MPIETSVSIIIDRMKQSDVVNSGIQFRFQQAILRFLPNAEVQLARAFEIVSSQASWVAVNMVGREDNDKGHPRRFLAPIRALRREYPGVALSIHGGEVDEPNSHVRDTLLLGATRVGHAANLISDEELLQSMRFGPYLVEINLISNLKLEYVPRLDTHPFPEYLRLGVPVALSTDDRGMWDTNITDEFFVAVHHFNLTWDELSALSVASLSHAFLPETTKHEVIARFQAALDDFALEVMAQGVPIPSNRFQKRRAFICENYQVCGNFN
jgi:adenosine deaminase CECR1